MKLVIREGNPEAEISLWLEKGEKDTVVVVCRTPDNSPWVIAEFTLHEGRLFLYRPFCVKDKTIATDAMGKIKLLGVNSPRTQ